MAPLMPVAEALEAMLGAVRPIAETLSLPLARLHGQVLAADQYSLVDVPPADNSAMDGYAVRAADLAGQAQAGALPVVQYLPAGTVGQALAPGTAARIFTGAPLPPGADAVIPQEDAREEASRVRFSSVPEAGQHIRRAGEDLQNNALVLSTGRRLRPEDVGLLASAGIAKARVFRPLRIAILSTGDELLEVGEAPVAGRLYNSNRYTLMGLLDALGMEIVDGGTAPDSPEHLAKRLAELACRADCVLSTGGVSVGERDYLRTVLEQIGVLRLWRIAIKPGKPLVFGTIENTPFFGLPGNPAAVFVTFCILVRPCLLKMQGATETEPPVAVARAGFERAASVREEYLRARLQCSETGEQEVIPFSCQGSGLLSTTSRADCLARVPAAVAIRRGDPLQVLLLRPFP